MAIPMTIFFWSIFGVVYLVSRKMKLTYEDAVACAFIVAFAKRTCYWFNKRFPGEITLRHLMGSPKPSPLRLIRGQEVSENDLVRIHN